MKKCQQRVNFLRTITGSWWGAHPGDLIRLFLTTVLSVIEYGCFCFRSAANTHLIKLERLQYRCLRIALGCMHSTHTMSLEVLACVVQLKDRFWDLTNRMLIKCEVLNPFFFTLAYFPSVYFRHCCGQLPTPRRRLHTQVPNSRPVY